MRSFLLTISAFLVLFGSSFANNIRILDTPQIDKINDSIANITFTIAWDNSWKSSKPANHDAAWIYVKCWDGDQWNHAYLSENGHIPGDDTKKDYRVENRDKTFKKCPMTYRVGYSSVYKQWHVDPTEKPVKGVVGLFLYRKDTLGEGDIIVPGVTLRWNYKDQGFSQDDDLVVKVFGVEMVYVPKGDFYMGGLGTAGNQPYSITTNTNVFGTPLYVTSEDSITITSADSDPKSFYFSGLGVNILNGGLSKKFPKGHQAFYCMKYELTQEAYAEFLNTLLSGQQDGRIQGVLSSMGVGSSIWAHNSNLLSYRHYVEVVTSAPVFTFGVDANGNNKWNETTKVTNKSGDSCEMSIDGQDLAINFVSFFDLLAYADFAGLRPMTEMEYEKACRGHKPVVSDEYAWGIHTLTYYNAYKQNGQIINEDKGNECLLDIYNCGAAHTSSTSVYSGSTYNRYDYSCPLRVGCFADSVSTRIDAGATYWGIMNMSDNCSELCISLGGTTAGTTTGRLFEGVHGDGQLTTAGEADVEGWHITTAANYYIPRGMVFPSGNLTRTSGRVYADGHNNTQVLAAGMVSSRYYAAHANAGNVRVYLNFMSGIRCVRTEETEL